MAMTQSAPRAPVVGSGDASLFAGAGWPLVLFVWAVFAAATAINDFPAVIDKLSTDDAMRLVGVRDLLAGQSWFDLTQRRLNPPDGVLMHWSRVIDLPIAAMLGAFRLVASEDLAVRLTITIWPLLLFVPAILAAASASRALAGSQAAFLCAFMMVMSPGVTQRFAPGAIDHHGAQVALALALLACALRLDRSVWAGVGAGLAAALMMAIGMETAPHVVACAAFVALRWAMTGDEGVARGAGVFGLSFAAFTTLAAFATLPPESWMAPACDALGIGHIFVAAIGGIGLFAATRYASASVAGRLAALAQIGVAVVAGVVMAAPNCLSSPFAGLPERMRTDWLARVQEAQNLFASAVEEPTAGIAIGLPLLMLVGVAVWALAAARREDCWKVATAAVMCAAACAVTVWQIRGVSFAFALGAPLLPMAVLAVGRTCGRVAMILALAAFSPATLALAGLGLAQIVGLPPIDVAGSSKTCGSNDYKALGRLPAGLALNTIDTGPSVLAHSRLSVVAAPYHRNVDGIMAEIEAFRGTEETARAIAMSRGAAYVVACPTDGGVKPAAAAYPDGFSAALLAGRPPAWLERVDLGPDAKLMVYRVLAGR